MFITNIFGFGLVWRQSLPERHYVSAYTIIVAQIKYLLQWSVFINLCFEESTTALKWKWNLIYIMSLMCASVRCYSIFSFGIWHLLSFYTFEFTWLSIEHKKIFFLSLSTVCCGASNVLSFKIDFYPKVATIVSAKQ